MTATRRGVLTGGAAAGLGAAVGATETAALTGRRPPATADTGTAEVAFPGSRQAGVTTEPTAHAAYVAMTCFGAGSAHHPAILRRAAADIDAHA